MSSVLMPPFFISYDGNDAAHNIINAQKLGESLIGASKLYSAVSHYCMYGTVPRGNYQKRVICYVKPPAEGCFEYLLFIGSVGSEGALFNDVIKSGLTFLLPAILSGVKKVWSRPSDTEKVVDRLATLIEKQTESSKELEMLLVNGLLKSHDDQAKSNNRLMDIHEKLILTLGDLAGATRGHARDVVSPVGNTCTSVTQFAHSDHEITIDEAEAEVIRGGDEMEIDEMEKFKCKRITEINVENGHCFLQIEGFGACQIFCV